MTLQWVVAKVAEKHGTTEVATEYLKYLYSNEGQDIIARNFYRPSNKDIAGKYAKQFPALELVTIDQLGGWPVVQKKHFDEGGLFDKIYDK